MAAGILLVRLRSDVNVRGDISDTMKMLNLTRVNHATIVPDTAEYRGMVRKVQDYCTFGPATVETVETLLRERGRAEGDKPLTDEVVSTHSDHGSIAEYAQALAAGETRLGVRRLVEGSKTRTVWAIKPVLRLDPPTKGHEGIKHHFASGGALGNRGAKVTDLVTRMV